MLNFKTQNKRCFHIKNLPFFFLNLLVSFFILIGNVHAFPLVEDERNIRESFTGFFQSTFGTPEKVFHHIQENDFESGPYIFHSQNQSLYRSRTADYRQYEPLGPITITGIYSHEAGIFLTAQWLLKDNSTPGMSSPFIMNFDIIRSQEKIPDALQQKKSSELEYGASVPAPSAAISDEVFPRPYSEGEALHFVSTLGFDGKDLNMTIFASWFCKKYLGFTKKNLGFDDETGKPMTFNMEVMDFKSYLDIVKDHFVSLDISKFNPAPREIGWLKEMLNGIYHSLQEQNSYRDLRPDSDVRKYLSVKDSTLQLDGQVATVREHRIYAISQNWDFYIEGRKYGNHPILLRGYAAWCAGEILIIKGKIFFLSNHSGHYSPHPYQLYTFAQELNKASLFAEEAEIQVISQGIGGREEEKIISVDTFLKEYDAATLKKDWEAFIQQKTMKDLLIKFILEHS
ncbi:MAG: hypothetical protein B7Y25_05395 [Alphaproteobacteria bacterium 16-39-46]|nr:MAG: hypothetical protein B7Y25_05395 [Alphaproteobacteria bacterium 16-39-46]OZA42663.1 MAG: hypothetical protein B7X84_05290 [Alphaproteobacteria bacterium 17-39-52]HQS84360.1 hypothetical protein [Alphaproteobacteria bacterium]HQS94194.1 hypothetical protein [Alphaproteobacteria bacterium]